MFSKMYYGITENYLTCRKSENTSPPETKMPQKSILKKEKLTSLHPGQLFLITTDGEVIEEPLTDELSTELRQPAFCLYP